MNNPNTQYWSQFEEDKWLDEHCYLKDKGVYVDIGAAWPTTNSNTALLRQKGWTGIAVEANSLYVPAWKAMNLDLVVGIISPDQSSATPFNFHEDHYLSSIQPGAPVMPAIKLNDLLAERNITTIDLLSIDVEGAEYDILTTLDWDKYKPKIIIFEFNTMGKMDYRLCGYLADRGYKPIHRTVCNCVVIHTEQYQEQ